MSLVPPTALEQPLWSQARRPAPAQHPMAPPASAAIIEAPANHDYPSSPEAHPATKRRAGGVAAGHRAPLTPGEERVAAAESEKNRRRAAGLSARVADDDGVYEGPNCPPPPPTVTRKYK